MPTVIEKELGYIAGFFDGEGTVNLGRREEQFRAQVLYTNNHRPTLEWIQARCGGAIYEVTANRGPLRENQTTYALRFGREASDFLLSIRDLLIQKQEQVDNVLEFFAIKREARPFGKTPAHLRHRLEHCVAKHAALSTRAHGRVAMPPELIEERIDQLDLEMADA